MRSNWCWICALRGGGHGGPIYWLQRWHLNRICDSPVTYVPADYFDKLLAELEEDDA